MVIFSWGFTQDIRVMLPITSMTAYFTARMGEKDRIPARTPSHRPGLENTVKPSHVISRTALLTALALCPLWSGGCQALRAPPRMATGPGCSDIGARPWVPRELDMATAPMYRVEPPDILAIDVTQQISQTTHLLQTGDMVLLMVTGTYPDEPISGEYLVGTGGVIELGYSYGAVDVGGQTVHEAAVAIASHLRKQLRDPGVSLSLRSVSSRPQLSGEFMVVSDGTITLGPYGSISVVGQTLDEVRETITRHLSGHFDHPEVSVSVSAFNSKVYYVVLQGGGMGDQLARFPCTGNETVMDALSQMNGLCYESSARMWIARPDRDCGTSQILPIDWQAISQRADVETNYQLMPGDRLYVAHDRWVALDVAIIKLARPIERVFGFTILGTGAASRLSGKVLRNDLSILAPVY